MTNDTLSLNKDKSIARYIDHTLLKSVATVDDINILCKEAIEYNFASVCVNPFYVKQVANLLANTQVKTCSVVGFPLGLTTAQAKAEETTEAVKNGAQEIDMVINMGAVKSKNWDCVKADIESVVNAAKPKAIVKVIIEACLLSEEEKIKACDISKIAGADFVKTSTGFSTGGAIKEDIELMRKTVGANIGVKASGGVRDLATAKLMIMSGASRIGTSSGIKIVKEEKGEVSSSIEGDY